MPSPKKKLPTGPIRINPPVAHYAETNAAQTQAHTIQPNREPNLESIIVEKQKPDSSFIDTGKLQDSNIDPGLTEASLEDVNMLDSSNQDKGGPKAIIEESEPEEETRRDVVFESGNRDSGLSESGLTETEYKKVAMRLSSEAVESLRQLRATTGVPYEILVDVMIRHWDKLPQRTRAAYLQEAKQVRGERLIAGQEKTMKTLRTKYLAQ